MMTHAALWPQMTHRLAMGVGIGLLLHAALYAALQTVAQPDIELSLKSAPSSLHVSFKEPAPAKPVQKLEAAEQPVKPLQKKIVKPVTQKQVELMPSELVPELVKQAPQQPVIVQEQAPAPLPLVKNVALKGERVPPKYPARALRAGWEGVVVLHVTLNAAGGQESLMIHQSSGYALLDREARKAVSKWRFLPTEIAGKHVASLVEVPVEFTLQ